MCIMQCLYKYNYSIPVLQNKNNLDIGHSSSIAVIEIIILSDINMQDYGMYGGCNARLLAA